MYDRHFPADTCGMSRQAMLVSNEMRKSVSRPRETIKPLRDVLLDGGYDADHYAAMLETTVMSLWRAREKIRKLEAEIRKMKGKLRGRVK